MIGLYQEKKRFDLTMNEIVYDGAIELLSDERIERIVSFGEEVEHTPTTFTTKKKP